MSIIRRNDVPGMSRATLDGNGRLLDFSAVPRAADPPPAQPAGPEAVFRAARLDMAAFTEAAPLKLPSTPFDQWRAWMGPHPHFPDTRLQVEAAWWKGRIVSVRVLYPREQKPAAPQAGSTAGPRDIAIPIMIAMAAFFVVLRAHRNWKSARADRAGAFHIALASFLLQAVAWAGSFHPVADLSMLDLLVAAVADWLLGAAVLWFAYLALEPEIRSRWPHSIVTWNRVLGGKVAGRAGRFSHPDRRRGRLGTLGILQSRNRVRFQEQPAHQLGRVAALPARRTPLARRPCRRRRAKP